MFTFLSLLGINTYRILSQQSQTHASSSSSSSSSDSGLVGCSRLRETRPTNFGDIRDNSETLTPNFCIFPFYLDGREYTECAITDEQYMSGGCGGGPGDGCTTYSTLSCPIRGLKKMWNFLHLGPSPPAIKCGRKFLLFFFIFQSVRKIPPFFSFNLT